MSNASQAQSPSSDKAAPATVVDFFMVESDFDPMEAFVRRC